MRPRCYGPIRVEQKVLALFIQSMKGRVRFSPWRSCCSTISAPCRCCRSARRDRIFEPLSAAPLYASVRSYSAGQLCRGSCWGHLIELAVTPGCRRCRPRWCWKRWSQRSLGVLAQHLAPCRHDRGRHSRTAGDHALGVHLLAFSLPRRYRVAGPSCWMIQSAIWEVANGLHQLDLCRCSQPSRLQYQ